MYRAYSQMIGREYFVSTSRTFLGHVHRVLPLWRGTIDYQCFSRGEKRPLEGITGYMYRRTLMVLFLHNGGPLHLYYTTSRMLVVKGTCRW
jgi:hypothetical protein